MNISVCADIMYYGKPFSDKIKNLKQLGINTIEFWNWSDKNSDELQNTVNQENMTVACFCVDSSSNDIKNKIGKYMLNSENTDELKTAVIQSVDIAKKLNTKSLIVTVGDNIDGLSYEEQIKNVYNSINTIKGIFEENDMTLLIEPINRQERKAYLTPNVKTVIEIVQNINSPNVKVLYDIYHQAMEKDFNISEMLEALPYIGHIHIADVPGRHEPTTGEIDYKNVFDALKKANYTGYIGAEFSPEANEQEALEILNKLF